MVLWIIFALLTAGVAAALLVPLARATPVVPAPRAGDVEVYRDQLEELDRDRAQGLIGEQEAEYARAEIGRRLLAAAGVDGAEKTLTAKAARHPVATAVVTSALKVQRDVCGLIAMFEKGE